jgi:hypothetical protein
VEGGGGGELGAVEGGRGGGSSDLVGQVVEPARGAVLLRPVGAAEDVAASGRMRLGVARVVDAGRVGPAAHALRVAALEVVAAVAGERAPPAVGQGSRRAVAEAAVGGGGDARALARTCARQVGAQTPKPICGMQNVSMQNAGLHCSRRG